MEGVYGKLLCNSVTLLGNVLIGAIKPVFGKMCGLKIPTFKPVFPVFFAIARDKFMLVENGFEGNSSFIGTVVVNRNLQD